MKLQVAHRDKHLVGDTADLIRTGVDVTNPFIKIAAYDIMWRVFAAEESGQTEDAEQVVRLVVAWRWEWHPDDALVTQFLTEILYASDDLSPADCVLAFFDLDLSIEYSHVAEAFGKWWRQNRPR